MRPLEKDGWGEEGKSRRKEDIFVGVCGQCDGYGRRGREDTANDERFRKICGGEGFRSVEKCREDEDDDVQKRRRKVK